MFKWVRMQYRLVSADGRKILDLGEFRLAFHLGVWMPGRGICLHSGQGRTTK